MRHFLRTAVVALATLSTHVDAQATRAAEAEAAAASLGDTLGLEVRCWTPAFATHPAALQALQQYAVRAAALRSEIMRSTPAAARTQHADNSSDRPLRYECSPRLLQFSGSCFPNSCGRMRWESSGELTRRRKDWG